jgi:hypothetical protein
MKKTIRSLIGLLALVAVSAFAVEPAQFTDTSGTVFNLSDISYFTQANNRLNLTGIDNINSTVQDAGGVTSAKVTSSAAYAAHWINAGTTSINMGAIRSATCNNGKSVFNFVGMSTAVGVQIADGCAAYNAAVSVSN